MLSLVAPRRYRQTIAVPEFEAFLLPVLRAFGDGRELGPVEVRARVAKEMRLDEMDPAAAGASKCLTKGCAATLVA